MTVAFLTVCILSFLSSVTQVAPEIHLRQLPLQVCCPHAVYQATRKHLLSDECTRFFSCSVICNPACPWLGWGALWWCESPHLGLPDPPLGAHKAVAFLTVHQGAWRGPSSGLDETTKQKCSASGSDSVLSYKLPDEPSASLHWTLLKP